MMLEITPTIMVDIAKQYVTAFNGRDKAELHCLREANKWLHGSIERKFWLDLAAFVVDTKY